jgi:predicted nucleic acid-binding protein
VILVDTSVWIDYFRKGLPELAAHLRRSIVVMHPFVVGELACGNFTNRDATLELLQQLRSVTVAEHHEVLSFMRAAAAAIERCQLWTLDKRLHALAATLGIAGN